MKRLMVNCTDGRTCNIQADQLVTNADDTNYIIAKLGGEIVGVFDIGSIATLYLSEQGCGRPEGG